MTATARAAGRLLALAFTLILAGAAANAPAAPPGSDDGPTLTIGTVEPEGPYVNPFADGAWRLGRTDMGVDWGVLQREPVVAIGDALILGSSDHAPWPGRHEIWYRLLRGRHAGNIVYVAEHLARIAHRGRKVHAGEQIAVALPGWPWSEWGWANARGVPLAKHCYREGQATQSGREMSRFLGTLGAEFADFGNVPDHPSGRPC
jgi:hypothetical protein